MAALRSESLIVGAALAEDLGAGDVTSAATVPEGARARARIVQKEPGVVFGLDVVAEAMRQCGVEDVDKLVVEGQWRDGVPAEVALAGGPAAGLLAAERVALNFLGHLSGVATLTARFVEAVAGTGARILDTRKTTPGLRALEKAAVVAGGGVEPPHGPLRRDPDQGEPRRPRRRRGQGGARRPRGAAGDADRGRVPQHGRGRLRAGRRRRPPAARQHGLGDLRAAVELRDEHGGSGRPSWRPPAASTSKRCASSPRPASTTSRSARSPTPRRRSTSACCSSGLTTPRRAESEPIARTGAPSRLLQQA